MGIDGRFAAFGRISSFHGNAFDMFVPIDPFITCYRIASLASTFSEAGGLRVDNANLYRKPRLAGFQAGYIRLDAASREESYLHRPRGDLVATHDERRFNLFFCPTTRHSYEKVLDRGGPRSLVRMYGTCSEQRHTLRLD